MTAEREPLLPRGAANPPLFDKLYVKVVAPCFVLLFTFGIIANLMVTASNQIQERIICRTFYDNVTHPTTDPRCKDDRVQSELSFIYGIESTISLIPQLLFAIPFGLVADVYGRRLVLLLAIFGSFAYELLRVVICKIFPHGLWLSKGMHVAQL